MGVYIPNLTLPNMNSGGYHIKIDGAGLTKVYAINPVDEFWQEELLTHAIEIPVPHGDLVEREAVLNTFSTHMNRTLHFTTIRDKVPTVLEAEGKDEN